ncbi:MAG: response regulator [bacterium]
MPKKRILVVDDEKDIRDTLRDVLEDRGYEVLLGADGYEALRIVEEEVVDLILLDIVMPRMDGAKACSIMRERGISIPIVVFTGTGKQADIDRAKESGADDYIVKPCGERDVIEKVEKWLKGD